MRHLAASAVVALAIACGGGWSIDLPNGYKLTSYSANEAGIERPDGLIVVSPDVAEYAVIEHLVVGRAQVPTSLEGQPPPPRVSAGYFVLNTESGESTEHEVREHWLARLRDLGVEQEPILGTPTMFD